MTVSTTLASVVIPPNTINAGAPIPFNGMVLDPATIVVTYGIDNTAATLNVDYTVALADDFNSANITPTIPLVLAAAGFPLLIRRILPPLQSLQLPLNHRVVEPELERALDLITLVLQQHADQLGSINVLAFAGLLAQFPSLLARITALEARVADRLAFIKAGLHQLDAAETTPVTWTDLAWSGDLPARIST